MTYSILSLASGSILESYASEERAMEAAARMAESEPTVSESLAFVTFDDEGDVVDALDGHDLAERLQAFVTEHHTATA